MFLKFYCFSRRDRRVILSILPLILKGNSIGYKDFPGPLVAWIVWCLQFKQSSTHALDAVSPVAYFFIIAAIFLMQAMLSEDFLIFAWYLNNYPTHLAIVVPNQTVKNTIYNIRLSYPIYDMIIHKDKAPPVDSCTHYLSQNELGSLKCFGEYFAFSCIWDKDFRINFWCWKMSSYTPHVRRVACEELHDIIKVS